LDIYSSYNQYMKVTNIAELKQNLSRYIAAVERGEEVEVRRRNVPIARVVPISGARKNRTVLGCGRGSAAIHGDLTEPLIPEGDWEMLGGSGAVKD
jgi:prevent-host-death family protein